MFGCVCAKLMDHTNSKIKNSELWRQSWRVVLEVKGVSIWQTTEMNNIIAMQIKDYLCCRAKIMGLPKIEFVLCYITVRFIVLSFTPFCTYVTYLVLKHHLRFLFSPFTQMYPRGKQWNSGEENWTWSSGQKENYRMDLLGDLCHCGPGDNLCLSFPACNVISPP